MTDPHMLFADRLLHVYKRSETFFVHRAAIATALAGFLVTEVAWELVAAWLAFVVVAMGTHSFQGRKLVVGHDKRTLSGIGIRRLTVAAALAGLAWGSGAAFLPYVTAPLQLLVVLTLTAIAAASLPRMSAVRVIHTAFMTGLFVPVIVALLIVFGADQWMMAGVVLVVWGGLADEARKAHSDLMEMYTTQQCLEDEAVRDRLTGIPNRRSFDASLEREWSRAQRLAVPISLIMIDVDFFKKFNDRYGHPAGDRCLAQVAQALAGGARRASDLVARYGGEEFVVLLFHTPRDDALAVAESLRLAVLALRIEHQDAPAGIASVSVGGATCIPEKDGLPDSLLRAADTALYEAKATGRNRVVWAGAEHCTSGLSELRQCE